MTDLKKIDAITQALQAAEMRQGCTNHSHYAWQLARELGLVDILLPAERGVKEIPELPLLEFTEEQVLGLIPAQALVDYDRAKEVLDKVAKAQRALCLAALKGGE